MKDNFRWKSVREFFSGDVWNWWEGFRREKVWVDESIKK
jgi:hypothetical protein